jgi:outer membrane murein-binding lipoprotein Lpp
MKRFMILENVDCRFINRKSSTENRKSSVLSAVLCLLSLTGCANPKVKESPAIKIEQLTQENTQLAEQVEKLTSQNKELNNQIQVLSGLPENVKLESIDRLESIRIGRYTGFFDKNNDGKKETLIVYIQPIDKQGDIIKEFGSVEVQLWDLNKPENKALLGQWKIGLDELKKLWFATVITSNYRLTFNVADIIDNLQEPLTVRVTFTDYPTGKVFTDQKVIEAP